MDVDDAVLPAGWDPQAGEESREDDDPRFTTGQIFWITGGATKSYFVVLMVCQAMGSAGFLLSPSQAAWCPLILLAPVAAALSQPLWE